MKNRKMKSYLFAVVAIIVIAALILLPTLISAGKNASSNNVSIQSAQAEKTSMTTSLSGSGTLTNDNNVEVSVPDGVVITKYLVSDGDDVTEGTALATVDPVSVTSAISEVQDSLDKVEEEINDLDDASTTETITTTMDGRVKKIFVAAGDNVKDAMVANGAAVLISLDGKMAVDIDTTAVSEGDTVTVSVGGTDYEGSVESVSKKTATITLTDDGPEYGAEATVTGSNGASVGNGTLYIHSAWSLGAYSGTVSNVYVSENQSVSDGTSIFALEDVDTTAKYDMLTAEHRVYEDLMDQLFDLNEDATVYAECDGMITGVDDTLLEDEEETTVTSSSAKADNSIEGASTDGVSASKTAYVTNADDMCAKLLNADDSDNEAGLILTMAMPDESDSSGYTNTVGVVTAVNGETISLNVKSDPVTIEDYSALSGQDTSQMITPEDFTLSVPAYKLSGSEWIQISAADIQVGNVVAIACSVDDTTTPLWVIVAEQDSSGEDSGNQPDSGGNSDVPGGQTPDGGSGQSGQPGGGGMDISDMINNGTISQDASSGGYSMSDLGTLQSSMTGSGSYYSDSASTSDLSTLYGNSTDAAAQVANAMYSTVKTTIMSVVPLDKVSVDISVDELDILAVQLNQEASVTLDALPGQSFTAIVTEIDPNGENEGGNTKYTVTLSMDRTEDMLEGMNASAVIEMSQNDDILTVPASAIYDKSGHSYVYTALDGDKLETETEVETGISDGENVEITSGLSEGDTVYYEQYGEVQ